MPKCCNPAHLSLGTAQDNSRDMARKLRGRHKYTLVHAEQMRALRRQGFSYRDIDWMFQASHGTSRKAIIGRTYSDTRPAMHVRKTFERPATPCWLWDGYPKDGSYGRVKVNGRWRGVHQRAWELTRGAIPDGLQVLHLCENKRCFSVDHLELGTPQNNSDDYVMKRAANGAHAQA